MGEQEEQKMTQTEITFKKNIKELRKSLPGCINHTKAAEKIGISQRYYSHLENINEHKQVSYAVMEKIATAYEVKVSDLFKEIPD